MAHRNVLTSIWTSVLAALVALLSCFGLAGKAAPAPAAVAPAAHVMRRPAVVARRTWRAMMRGGSLPPTIKQRIRAEAHGKTPSVRRSTTAASMGAGAEVARRSLIPVAAPVAAPVAVHSAATAGASREALRLAA
ncbi:DUF6344 domain-containing protein [Streptomyces sp. NPDC054932]